MAMLAEPRRFRKKFNLVPRGKPLFDDENRFGTKMLERMGWTKGKGLGAREDGSQEFVRIRYKNDSNGIGYEDRNDQWTEHEKQFNGLLSSLHNSEENSEADDEEKIERVGFGYEQKKKNKDNKNVKDKISGESLEEKSKNSKARVHYKKFTKGKDLSQYSEKDLANIFGKKAEENTNFQTFEPIVVENIGKDINGEENTDDNKKFGITTINTGTSVSDYFKQKMEEMKSKRKLGISQNVDSLVKFVYEPINKQPNIEEFENSDFVDAKEICKKKKQKNTDIIHALSQNTLANMEEFSKKESKKENRKFEISDNRKLSLGNSQEPISEKLKQNPTEKSKKIRENLEISNENLKEPMCEEMEQIPKKKSKRKKRKLEISDNGKLPLDNFEEPMSTELEQISKEKSKNKRAKLEIADNVKLPFENLMEPISEELEQIAKEKSKKKRGNLEISENKEKLQFENFHEPMSTELEQISTEKSKKKKRKLDISDNGKLPLDNFQEPMSMKTEQISKEKSKKKREKLKIADSGKLPFENLKELISEELEQFSIEKSKKKKWKLVTSDNNETLSFENLKEPISEELAQISTDKLGISYNGEHQVENLQISISEELEQRPTEKLVMDNEGLKTNCLSNLEHISQENKLVEITNPNEHGNSVYTISEYCAEKFRHTNLHGFKNSNLLDIVGYGLDKQKMKLDIVHLRADTENIQKLYTKYADLSLTDKYHLNMITPLAKHYKKVNKAKKNKKKIPKINIKRFKNRSIFTTI